MKHWKLYLLIGATTAFVVAFMVGYSTAQGPQKPPPRCTSGFSSINATITNGVVHVSKPHVTSTPRGCTP